MDYKIVIEEQIEKLRELQKNRLLIDICEVCDLAETIGNLCEIAERLPETPEKKDPDKSTLDSLLNHIVKECKAGAMIVDFQMHNTKKACTICGHTMDQDLYPYPVNFCGKCGNKID